MLHHAPTALLTLATGLLLVAPAPAQVIAQVTVHGANRPVF